MVLTETQLQTFADDLAANDDPEILAALAAGNNNKIAKWYNTEASPAFWVFLSSVSVDEIRKSLDWDEVLNSSTGLTQIQQFGFNVLLHNDTFDPAEENNRNGLVKVFPSSMPNTRAAVLADATRKASRIEKLFAVAAGGPGGGDGSDQSQSAVAGFEGEITKDDVRDALPLMP